VTSKRNGRAARTLRKANAEKREAVRTIGEDEKPKSEGQLLTEQLARLDTRLGVGVGAKRERASIARKMQEA
jgi:hypothetical protein